MESEIWKDIPGFIGLYQASNLGRVKSLDRTTCHGKNIKGKIINPIKNHNSYKVVIYKYGVSFDKTLSKLIATVFIDNPNNYNNILFIDRDNHNIRVDNMIWVDSRARQRPTTTGAHRCSKCNKLSLFYRPKLDDYRCLQCGKITKPGYKVQSANMFEAINEYKTGKYTSRVLAKKYQVSNSTICKWVKDFG